MNKKAGWILGVSILLVFVLLIAILFFFLLYHPNHEVDYAIKLSSGQIVNPVSTLTTDAAVQQFNQTFVYYLLYTISAYNLHNPPLSTNTPKMLIYVDSDVYNAEIVNCEIYVSEGTIENEDIVIKTTKLEAVKMLQNKNYISTSFSSGMSSIQLVANKAVLFSKGYLNLYDSLTGKSITGNIIKIYSS